ncbi:hypothetical protein GQ53DRAFT_774585 [Thozetella sp. PMI_491]|nr:hypothetical protein GQ53DRAFT_774585 [Thozetella sp. PMI_491]
MGPAPDRALYAESQHEARRRVDLVRATTPPALDKEDVALAEARNIFFTEVDDGPLTPPATPNPDAGRRVTWKTPPRRTARASSSLPQERWPGRLPMPDIEHSDKEVVEKDQPKERCLDTKDTRQLFIGSHWSFVAKISFLAACISRRRHARKRPGDPRDRIRPN